MANIRVDQVRTLNYGGEDIGMGFNSDTGLAVGTALNFTLPDVPLAQVATGGATIVTSHEELMKQLHTSAEAEGRYYFISGGGKVDFSEKTDYNTASTFVVAALTVQNTVQRGKDFALKPSLQHLLDTNQTDVFNTAFGDSFVRGHFNGGEFYAVMRLTSTSSETETKLATSLHAEFQSGAVSGSFKGDLENAKKDIKNHTEFSVQFYQKGGAGSDEIGTTLDVDEIKKRLKTLADAVKNHPFPYLIEVADYNTVPLPTPSKEQLEDLLLAIADDQTKKLRYLQGRNDCDFAAEHPEYFTDPPPAVVLRATSATYTQLFNAVLAHAIGLSKGEIPPSLFDPSTLHPPIIEPSLALRKRDLLLEGSFADFWVNKDSASIRKNDRDLVVDIGNRAASKINSFETIVDPSGDPVKTARLQGDALARVVASFRDYNWEHIEGGVIPKRGPLDSLSVLPNLLPRTMKSLIFAGNFPDSLGNAIRDCKGLELFPLLVELHLSHNAISAIDELGSLKGLRTLLLVDNRISDLSPLSGCISLQTLDISGNQISDLTPLSPCKALRNLTLFGTEIGFPGGATPSDNPITDILALGSIPNLANPFTLGTVLSVRFGTLTDGPAAQFSGTATRIDKSNAFRVHLTRGLEVMDDVWSLRSIKAVDRSLVDGFKFFFPSLHFGDIPTSGSFFNIGRASNNNGLEFNFSFVDPTSSLKSGIDLTSFPAFGTTITIPTFDATVIS